jgi:hypothetical protein
MNRNEALFCKWDLALLSDTDLSDWEFCDRFSVTLRYCQLDPGDLAFFKPPTDRMLIISVVQQLVEVGPLGNCICAAEGRTGRFRTVRALPFDKVRRQAFLMMNSESVSHSLNHSVFSRCLLPWIYRVVHFKLSFRRLTKSYMYSVDIETKLYYAEN